MQFWTFIVSIRTVIFYILTIYNSDNVAGMTPTSVLVVCVFAIHFSGSNALSRPIIRGRAARFNRAPFNMINPASSFHIKGYSSATKSQKTDVCIISSLIYFVLIASNNLRFQLLDLVIDLNLITQTLKY